MKLHEILNQVKDTKQWFRPVTMKGTGIAYMVAKHGLMYGVFRVPYQHMPTQEGITSNVDLLTGEWEIVDKEIVLGER